MRKNKTRTQEWKEWKKMEEKKGRRIKKDERR